MTDQPLVRTDETSQRFGSRPPIAAFVVGLLVVAILAASAWWYLNNQTQPPRWDRVPDVALAAPAGDPFREETPWATLQLAPAQSGETNRLRMSLMSRPGTPVAASDAEPRIVGMTTSAISANSETETLLLSPEPNATNAFTASPTFASTGWWRLQVDIEGAEQAAEFYLLIPDPNVNGPAAVATFNSTPDGEALFQRGLAGITSLQSVRYTQWLADGRGNAGLSEHVVSAGGDGSPPGFTYRAPGGMEAVVIGTTRWVRLPGDLGWTEQEGVASVPPSQWGEEYEGATQFAMLGNETVDGADTQVLAFLVPELTEPRRRSAAWYLWWIDVDTGHVRKEAMVSRLHYMLNQFSNFDAPVVLEPPVDQATPASATPRP